MTTEEKNSDQVKQTSKTSRKKPIRSAYLFPAYDFGTALQIAEKVDREGGGSLSEETLAINLKASAKSSGFRLRGLTARQFGLLTKQGDKLSITHLAEAIFRKTSDQEQIDAKRESFLRIPLFREVATRFKGQPLPPDEAFRNILEREFRIERNRVAAAHRVLIDSAREAGVLHTSGGNTYITTESIAHTFAAEREGWHPPTSPPSHLPAAHPIEATQQPAVSGSGLLTISEQDLEQLDDNEFDEVWGVLGKVLRARARAKGERIEERLHKLEVEEEETEDDT